MTTTTTEQHLRILSNKIMYGPHPMTESHQFCGRITVFVAKDGKVDIMWDVTFDGQPCHRSYFMGFKNEVNDELWNNMFKTVFERLVEDWENEFSDHPHKAKRSFLKRTLPDGTHHTKETLPAYITYQVSPDNFSSVPLTLDSFTTAVKSKF